MRLSASGDMFQYVDIGGKRYSHVVDPKTGLGLTDRSITTVVAPEGITSDGLSKVVAVLGPEKSFKLIDREPGVSAMVLRAGDGNLRQYQSARWKDLPVTQPESAAARQGPARTSLSIRVAHLEERRVRRARKPRPSLCSTDVPPLVRDSQKSLSGGP